MLENLSKTTLYGCLAVAAMGVLVASIHKKTGLLIALGGLGSAWLVNRYWYQPEQFRKRFAHLEQNLGHDADTYIPDPTPFSIPKRPGDLVLKTHASQRAKTHRPPDDISTDDEFSDGELSDGEENKVRNLVGFVGSTESHEGWNTIPLEDTPPAVVKLRLGLGNYILSFVGLGKFAEKEKTR